MKIIEIFNENISSFIPGKYYLGDGGDGLEEFKVIREIKGGPGGGGWLVRFKDGAEEVMQPREFKNLIIKD